MCSNRPPSPALLRAEVVALILALIPAVAGPFAFGAVHWWSAGLLAACAFLGLTLLVARQGGRPVFQALPIGFPAWCVWTGWIALRMVAVPPVPHAAILSFLQVASSLAAGAVVAALTSRSSRVWRTTTLVFLIALCAQAGFAIVQWVTEDPRIYSTPRFEQYLSRTSGTFLNPNDFAIFLVLGFCASLSLAFHRSARFSVRLFAATAALLCLPGILTSLSRAAGLSLAAGILAVAALLALQSRSWRTLALTTLLPALLAASAWMALNRFPDYRARWDKLFSRPGEYADGRSGMWTDTIRMILDKPAWGHGTGTFEDAAAAYRHDYHDWWATLDHAHNETIQVAADHGLVGAGLAILCAAMLMVSGLRAFRAGDSGAARLLPIGWLAMSVAALVHSLFDCSLRLFATGHSFMLVSALFGAAAARSAGRSKSAESPDRSASSVPPRPLPCRFRAGLTAAAALACGLACLTTWRGAMLEQQASECWKGGGYSAERIEPLLRSGLRVDPLNAFFPLELSKLARARIPFESVRERRVALLEEAEAWLARADRLHPNHLEVLEWKVDHLLQRGEGESALALARKVAAAYPSRVDARTQVGKILMRLGRYAEARQVLRDAWSRYHSLHPAPEARYWHGQVLRIEKELKQKSAPPPSPPTATPPI